MSDLHTNKFAVLIPVYNEEIVISETIDSLISAGIPKSDIYIVDDKSTDNTSRLATETGVSVYTVAENGGKARAQQASLNYFRLTDRYDWIIFLDGDTKIDSKFFSIMKNAADTAITDIGLFLGQVKSVKNNHIYSASRAFDYTYGQNIAKIGQSNFNVVFVAPGCASMYRSTVLSKLKIDYMTLAEDMDLTMQVHRAGYKVAYLHDAIVNTQDPSSFSDYHKQILRWYRGFWQVVKKHEIFSFNKKQRVDWYIMMITADAVIFNRIIWLIILAIMFPAAIPGALALDAAITCVIGIYSAFKTQRVDVIYKLPVYYWLSYLNFYVFMRTFIEVIIQRKELLSWNKVKRYDFDSHIEKEQSK